MREKSWVQTALDIDVLALEIEHGLMKDEPISDVATKMMVKHIPGLIARLEILYERAHGIKHHKIQGTR